MSSTELHKGLDNIIVKETRLSYIDGDRGILYYAGYPIEDLCRYSTYEEVLYLLWNGRLPDKRENDEIVKKLQHERSIPKETLETIRLTPKNAHPMDILKTAVASLGCFDPELEDNSREANVRKAIRLAAGMATATANIYRLREGLEIIPPKTDLSHAANFLYMLFGKEPDELNEKIMDVSLILHVEHELPASTMGCITTASTLSDIYSAVVTGIGTLKGPLHGGANEFALEMLLEIGGADNAEGYIKKAIADKKRIMGFGHRVYKAYDPRARIFREYFEKLSAKQGDFTLLNTAKKVEEVMVAELGAKKIFPNIDFYSGSVYRMLGIPSYLFTPMFAMSRVGGWTAHVIEYLEDNRLVRPRARYIGELDRKYVPIEQRT